MASTPLDLVHGWVSTDCGRGTSDILWSCLFTVFLCVWTAIHLRVPHYRGERPLPMRDKIVRSKVVPAIISIVVPELLVWTASIEYLNARQRARQLRRLTKANLSLTYGFFLDMGGICLESPTGRYHQLEKRDINHVLRIIVSVEDGPAFIGEGEVLHNNSKTRTAVSCNSGNTSEGAPEQETHTVSEQGDVNLYCTEWIPKLAEISENRIDSLTKSDSLTKLFACVQALWFVTQVISRLCERQAVTLLEVSTTAYVFCAILAFVGWWKKPQGCSMPAIIPCSDKAIDVLAPTSYDTVVGSGQEFIWGGQDWSYATNMGDVAVAGSLFYLFPTLFGAIHVASWDVVLPSQTELWMWRASTLYCLSVYPLGLGIVSLSNTFLVGKPWGKRVEIIMINGLFLPYVIVRIFMIVEIFVSLRTLTHSAYDFVHWSSFIPHI